MRDMVFWPRFRFDDLLNFWESYDFHSVNLYTCYLFSTAKLLFFFTYTNLFLFFLIFSFFLGGASAHGGIYASGGTPPSLAQLMAEEAIRQQKEADRRLAEEHDKLANTPEALAARDRVLAKFCK